MGEQGHPNATYLSIKRIQIRVEMVQVPEQLEDLSSELRIHTKMMRTEVGFCNATARGGGRDRQTLSATEALNLGIVFILQAGLSPLTPSPLSQDLW